MDEMVLTLTGCYIPLSIPVSHHGNCQEEKGRVGERDKSSVLGPASSPGRRSRVHCVGGVLNTLRAFNCDYIQWWFRIAGVSEVWPFL